MVFIYNSLQPKISLKFPPIMNFLGQHWLAYQQSSWQRGACIFRQNFVWFHYFPLKLYHYFSICKFKQSLYASK